MDILYYIESIFTDTYFHHKDVPKNWKNSERSIAERIRLRKGRSDVIKIKEQNINNDLCNAYFTNFRSPSNMSQNLSKTKDAVNEVQVELLNIQLKMMIKD